MASFLGTGPSFGHALETGAGSGYTRSNAKKQQQHTSLTAEHQQQP